MFEQIAGVHAALVHAVTDRWERELHDHVRRTGERSGAEHDQVGTVDLVAPATVVHSSVLPVLVIHGVRAGVGHRHRGGSYLVTTVS